MRNNNNIKHTRNMHTIISQVENEIMITYESLTKNIIQTAQNINDTLYLNQNYSGTSDVNTIFSASSV